jgi:hypothetical protein
VVILIEDAQLKALIEAIVPRDGSLHFSVKAKMKALERAASLKVDISDHLLEKNREYLERLVKKGQQPKRRSLLHQVTRITGIPSRELLSSEKNATQAIFANLYGEDLLRKIQLLANAQRPHYPDPQKDPAAYLQFWLRRSMKRADFFAHLHVVFPDLEQNALPRILAITADGNLTHTSEQNQFIERFGESFLGEVLLKFKHHPTDPRQ